MQFIFYLPHSIHSFNFYDCFVTLLIPDCSIDLQAVIDDFQANRSPEKTYVTQGLRGLWAHAKSGFSTMEDSQR